MNVEDNTSAPETTALTAEVTATGTASKRPSYEITAELRPHADAIMAMDLNSVPTPHSIPEGWGAKPLALRSTALPADMKLEVDAKLAQLGNVTPEERAAKEAQFTEQAIRSKRMELRVMTGVGKDATPYHREQVAIARDYRDLAAEFDRIQADLHRVARYENVTDPNTGEAKAVPVLAISAERQKAYIARQDDISRRMRLLVNDDGSMGYEGEQRLRQALHESSAARQKLAQQLYVDAEAKRRAAHNEQERRINERAESLARLQRNAS
jgi:hypothetical protein